MPRAQRTQTHGRCNDSSCDLLDVTADRAGNGGGVGDSNAALYATGFLKFTKRIRSIGSKKTLNKVLRCGLPARPPPCIAHEKTLEHNKNMTIVEVHGRLAGVPHALWIRAKVLAAPVVRPFGED